MHPSHDPTLLPSNLPIPHDDGAGLHLRGKALPPIALPCTDSEPVRLDKVSQPTVLFFYPRTGVPGQPPSLGFRGEDWDSIPGARGCTPQSCGFRDLHSEFQSLGITVFGVSTNTTPHQAEFKSRQHVPFGFLSDAQLELTRSLRLPTFEFPVESGGPNTLIKRMAWYIEPDDANIPRIRRVWYPVFPPDANARCVHEWLAVRRLSRIRPVRPSDRDFVTSELTRHWGSTTIYSRFTRFDADSLPAFVADSLDSASTSPLGLVTLHHGRNEQGERETEVITLSTGRMDRGIGARLLDAAEDAARANGSTRVFLTTGNDNLRALAFYQRRGWRVCNVHRGAIDDARAKANGPAHSVHDGIASRDEIELELSFREIRLSEFGAAEPAAAGA